MVFLFESLQPIVNTDFPEEYFLPDKKKESIYQYKVDSGGVMAKDKTILFCGICRNAGETLERNILCLHRTGSFFKDYKIFLYENDSSDNTVDILNKYKSNKFDFVSTSREDRNYRANLDTPVDPWHYQRCLILSDCRNKYLEYAQNISTDYICVLDLDLKGGWSYDGMKHGIYTLEHFPNCACISSYGILSDHHNVMSLETVDQSEYIMYDSFAFRPINIEMLHILHTPKFNPLKFERGEDPIVVNSNFGGMAVYKANILKKHKYSANHWKDGHVDPDHVTINRSIRKEGFNIVLDPSMITSYSNHRFSE